MLTCAEASRWLHVLKWHLADSGHQAVAAMVEEAEYRLDTLSPAQLREYADLVLVPGKRGRVTLVLHTPYEARAIAMLIGILKSISG